MKRWPSINWWSRRAQWYRGALRSGARCVWPSILQPSLRRTFDPERWPVAEGHMDLGSWPLGRGLGFYLFQLNGQAQPPADYRQILKIEITPSRTQRRA